VRAQRDLARAGRTKLARLRARYRSARRPHAQARLRRAVALATVHMRERRDGVGWARASADDYHLRSALNSRRALELAAFVAGR
jgi:phage shock protein A